MSKHKKTRQEKINADLRRQLAHVERKLPITTSPSITLKSQAQYNVSIKTTSLPASYLLQDLTKTALFTIAIVAGEFILFFLLKK